MKCKGIEATILCNEALMEEYQVTSEDGSGRCYIASEIGQKFQVELKNESDTDLGVIGYMDGSRMIYHFLGPVSRRKISGIQVEENTERPFMFTTLKLTDNEMSCAGSSDDLGTISLIFMRINRTSVTVPWEPDCVEDPSERVVHEKVKKVGTHQISLGAERPISTKWGARVGFEYIDFEDSPYVKFTFRYCPRDILQAQGIVPLAQQFESAASNAGQKRAMSPNQTGELHQGAGPSKRPRQNGNAHASITPAGPPPSGEDVKPVIKQESLHEEFLALQTQLRAIEARLSQVKSQMEAAPVKRETSPIRLKGASGEIIDLTLD